MRMKSFACPCATLVTLARQRTNALTNEPRMSKVLVDKRVAAPLVTSCITILLANPWQPDEFSTCSLILQKKDTQTRQTAGTSCAFQRCARSLEAERDSLLVADSSLTERRLASPSLFIHCFFRRLVISAGDGESFANWNSLKPVPTNPP